MKSGDRRLRYLGGREGIALITSMMVVALAVTVVVEFNRTATADIEISKNFSDEKKALFIAISGVNIVKDMLRLEGIYGKGDTLLDEWAKGKAHFDAANASLEEGKMEGVILDENSKINVNALVGKKGQFDETQMRIWERLLKQPRFGLTEDEVNTIIHGVKDWIDEDDEVTGIFGAEDVAYRAKDYRCKNGPLHTLEEMLLIHGVTREIFYGDQRREGIRPYFTIYGGSKININTAPLPIIMALSPEMTEDIALDMDKFRTDEENRWELSNKLWYRRLWPYGTALPEDALTASSETFSVYLKVTLRDSVKEVKAVIARAGEKEASVVYWQE